MTRRAEPLVTESLGQLDAIKAFRRAGGKAVSRASARCAKSRALCEVARVGIWPARDHCDVVLRDPSARSDDPSRLHFNEDSR